MAIVIQSPAKQLIFGRQTIPSGVGTGFGFYGTFPRGWPNGFRDGFFFGGTIADQNNMVWKVPGSFRNLSMTLSAAPGVGSSRTFYVQKNNTNTTLSVTFTDTETYKANISATLNVAEGDLLRFYCEPSGNPAATTIDTQVDFEANVPGEQCYGGITGNTGLSTGSVVYTWLFFPTFREGWFVVSNMPGRGLIPINGTINGYTVRTTDRPVGYTFCLYKAAVGSETLVRQDGTGGTVDTRLTITAGGSPSISTASFSLDVVDGEKVVIGHEPLANSFFAAVPNISVKFTADTPGQFMIGAHHQNYNNAEFHAVAGNVHTQSDGDSATEADITFRVGPPGVTAFGQRLWVVDPPGAGTSRTFVLRKNAVDTDIDLTISDPAQEGTGGGAAYFADGDHMTFRSATTGIVSGSPVGSWVIATTAGNAIVDDEGGPTGPPGCPDDFPIGTSTNRAGCSDDFPTF